jgi:undecaprenyl pyrophosphate phosphatase UppP
VLVPRNISLERVCALGKAAYQHDCQVNPTSLDWEFAFAVFTLDRHPMGGLLQGAGMKPRRPKWDGFRLIVSALLPIVAVGLLVRNGDGILLRSAGIVSGCVAIMLLMFLASRRIEKQRLEEDIERCRLASHFVGRAAR